jgi:Haspin like kinase domain
VQSYGLQSSSFGYSGLRTTVIDYTLSRAKYTRVKLSTTLYDPFKQASIFKAEGRTPEDRVQSETYRKMRAHALATEQQSYKEDPGRENKKLDKWARFMPRTNAMWLDYLLFTLLYRSGSKELEGSNEIQKDLQGRIYKTLEKTRTMLAGENEWRGKPPQSASDTIAKAHKEGLLGEDDLKAIKESLESE